MIFDLKDGSFAHVERNLVVVIDLKTYKIKTVSAEKPIIQWMFKKGDQLYVIDKYSNVCLLKDLQYTLKDKSPFKQRGLTSKRKNGDGMRIYDIDEMNHKTINPRLLYFEISSCGELLFDNSKSDTIVYDIDLNVIGKFKTKEKIIEGRKYKSEAIISCSDGIWYDNSFLTLKFTSFAVVSHYVIWYYQGLYSKFDLRPKPITNKGKDVQFFFCLFFEEEKGIIYDGDLVEENDDEESDDFIEIDFDIEFEN